MAKLNEEFLQALESDDDSDEATPDPMKQHLLKKFTKLTSKGKSSDPFFWHKFIKQMVLFLLWISMGYGRGLAGPVLPDLKEKFQCNYEEIGRAAAASAIGFVGGCLTGGIVHERWHEHTDLAMAIAILIGGIAASAIPWVPSLGLLIVLFIIVGFAGAVQNTGGNTMVLDLWGERAASAMFTLHLGYGIGAFLAPIIAEPFLSAKIGEHVIKTNISSLDYDTTSNETNITAGNWTNTTTVVDIIRPARLTFPFALEGFLDIFFAIAFLMYYIKGPPKDMAVKKGASNLKDLFNPAQCTAGNSLYGVLILVLLFMFYIQAIGGELVFGQFLYAFATESDVNFTTSQAANLTAVFYLCHLSGRALGAVLSKFLSINIILIIDVAGLLASTVFLSMFGFSVPLALWIGTGLIGLLCSFVYPAGMIWANLYMDVNSMVIMVTMFGGAVGFIIYTYLGGYLIQYVSMQSFLYLETAYAVILAVVFLLMFLLGKKYGLKKDRLMDSDDDDDDILEYMEFED